MHSLNTGGDQGRAQGIPHSPLQSLVQESDVQRQSGQQSYQRNPRLDVGTNRSSRDALERLIGNSFEKVGDDLLLSSRTRLSYAHQFEVPPVEERPLTSAGKKNRNHSRGESGPGGCVAEWFCLCDYIAW